MLSPTPTAADEKPKTIRLTIPVTPEVHEAFTRIAKATGRPVGRAMADWMGDTLDAANYLADTLEKAKQAPRLVAQQLHAYALGLTDMTTDLLEGIRKNSIPAAGGDAGAAEGAPLAGVVGGSGSRPIPDFLSSHAIPPSCNTGGKVPKPKGKGKGKQ